MRLWAARQAMEAQVEQSEVIRLSVGADTADAQQKSQNAQRKLERTICPWRKGGQKTDDLDAVAGWYIMYRPDRLKHLGVDFAPIESVSERR